LSLNEKTGGEIRQPMVREATQPKILPVMAKHLSFSRRLNHLQCFHYKTVIYKKPVLFEAVAKEDADL